MSGYIVSNDKSFLPDTSVNHTNGLNHFYRRCDCNDCNLIATSSKIAIISEIHSPTSLLNRVVSHV